MKSTHQHSAFKLVMINMQLLAEKRFTTAVWLDLGSKTWIGLGKDHGMM